jgi:hypothetical protein
MSFQQANVPAASRGVIQLLQDLAQSQELVVEPASIKTADGLVSPAAEGYVIRWLQNNGTTAVKVGLGPDVAEANSFHTTLAAGSADDDGTGGFIDLSWYKGDISIYSGGANRVTVTMARRAAGAGNQGKE